jgi:hypothetical protein
MGTGEAMTVEEAILILEDHKCPDDTGRDCGSYTCEECHKAIDMAIASLKQQQWIPCTERLPEKDAHYLCTDKYGFIDDLGFSNDLYSVSHDDFRDKKGVRGFYEFCEEEGFCESDDIVAWMPLPEPYKEKP